MARITSQKAEQIIGNKFDMILIAAARAREISKGSAPKVLSKNKPIVSALREIEAGVIGREYLRKVR